VSIEIPRELHEEMVAHARAGMPNEACGIVAGEDGRPVAVYPIRNAEESPVVYRFDDQQQLQVFEEIERKGWELLAFFHSHTHTEAFPSPTDVASAHWRDPLSGELIPAYPETRHVIISLRRDPPETRAFRFEDGSPVEEDVTIA
jgi:[CysO sulfur-carrier protein]-S-L-cysteine hydrolase